MPWYRLSPVTFVPLFVTEQAGEFLTNGITVRSELLKSLSYVKDSKRKIKRHALVPYNPHNTRGEKVKNIDDEFHLKV